MDFMPTGYLPDSVYRELAWYGILQIQPLHHSAKHKVAAELIWQHTLGRPHVILENTPQSTQSPGKVSRQILAEEAAKWSREQRAAQEVLMENIKSGGNGNYYKCPAGSEPDLDSYRVQGNLHERKCTYYKDSIQVPVDPCIEAEVTPIEFSFHEGWMFCLGNGERENNYFQNGTLDCGNKLK
ncbi:TRAP dicarboxylate transporter-DctP subunit, partial [Operophtera brumata]